MKITDIETLIVYGGRQGTSASSSWTPTRASTGVGESGLSSRELAVAGRRRAPQAVPDRQEPVPDRAALAGDVPRRLLPGRQHHHLRHRRHRHRPLGHQGQGAQRPDLRAVRRPGARQDRLLPARHAAAALEALVENAQKHVDEGWKFVRWGLGGPIGDGDVFEPSGPSARASSEFEALRKAARRRDRAVLRPAHPRRSAGRDPVLSRGRGVPPVLHRGPDPRREHVQPAPGPPARQRAAGRSASSSTASGSSARSSRRS